VSNDTLLFKRADPSQSFPLPPAPPFRFGGVFFLREVTTGALISFNCPDKLIDDTVEPLLICCARLSLQGGTTMALVVADVPLPTPC
jgi:hypothetical protein